MADVSRHAIKWTLATARRGLAVRGAVAAIVALPAAGAVLGRLPWFVPACIAVVVLVLAIVEGAYRAWDEAERHFQDELRDRDEQFNACLAHSAAMRQRYGSNIAPLERDAGSN